MLKKLLWVGNSEPPAEFITQFGGVDQLTTTKPSNFLPVGTTVTTIGVSGQMVCVTVY